ncbi:MAG TPA: hypothetical protein VMB21_17630 [Candidatus Limnocylindria bacterium]|nr:hypothetical protein [Candidatus Limnocylindria bacterium]
MVLVLTGKGGGMLRAETETIRGGVFPVRLRGDTQPALVIRIDRLARQNRRLGFFRIGSLPVLAATGVQFEIHDLSHLEKALLQAPPLIHASAAKIPLELRSVQWRLSGESVPLLSADEVRMTSRDHWTLKGHVTWRSGTDRSETGEVDLWVSGPRAGLLTVRTATTTTDVRWLPGTNSAFFNSALPISTPARAL